MKELYDIDGEQHDVRLAFLLLSLRERLALQRTIERASSNAGTVLRDARALAAACSAIAAGENAEKAGAYASAQAANAWRDVLDVDRINARLEYERLYEGPQFRDVPGFRSAALVVLDRELKSYRTPRRIARTIYAEMHAPHAGAPHLYLDRSELPAGVALSRLVDPGRPNEPLIVMGMFAYPVSAAWMVVPRERWRDFANNVAAWMTQHWPEALDVCRVGGEINTEQPLDRESMAFAAEAFTRGMRIDEAASFIFEARAASVEQGE